MTPQRWREIEEGYHEAMKLTDATERAAYLAQLDPAIRAEVEELLAQKSQDSPLDHRSSLFEALTPGAMLGHYRIEQSIGSGGMGEVYRATDTKLRRSVAIKVCGAGFVRRFEREARAIAALNHPNICTLYESGPDYLVMELVEGPTLADRIRKGAIPVKEAVDIARQIAEALEAAHEHGIIHRDLKPANIKLTADGRVKVLDFGLAKSITPTPPDAAAATITNTEQGLIVGTPSYMSPEQAEGLPTDKRADIWSFGVVVWEMLTGHRLFDAQSASRILSEVLQREIDFSKLPAAVPDHIRTLLRRCLDRNLKTRLRDIGEARIALLHPRLETDPSRKRFAPATMGVSIAAAIAVTWMGSILF
jgi:serine/threonine-protein kinase